MSIKTIITSLLGLFSLSVFSQSIDSIAVDRHTNGKIKVLTTYNETKESGINLLFDDSGRLITEENYKNGLLHGTKRRYSDLGRLSEEMEYKNGELDGTYRKYYK